MADVNLKAKVKLTADPLKSNEIVGPLKHDLKSLFDEIGGSELFRPFMEHAETFKRVFSTLHKGVEGSTARIKEHVDAIRSHFSRASGVGSQGKGASIDAMTGRNTLKDKSTALQDELGGPAADMAGSATTGSLTEGVGSIVETLGVGALGGIGLAVLGTVAMVGFIKSITAAGANLVDFNMKLGGGSLGAMGVVESVKKLQNTFLELDVGGKLASSTLQLNNAFFKLKSTIELDMVPLLKDLNRAMTHVINFTTDVVRNKTVDGVVKNVVNEMPGIGDLLGLVHVLGAKSPHNAANALGGVAGAQHAGVTPAAAGGVHLMNHGMLQTLKNIQHNTHETARKTAKASESLDHIEHTLHMSHAELEKAQKMSRGFYEFIHGELAPLGRGKPKTPQQRWEKKFYQAVDQEVKSPLLMVKPAVEMHQ